MSYIVIVGVVKASYHCALIDDTFSTVKDMGWGAPIDIVKLALRMNAQPLNFDIDQAKYTVAQNFGSFDRFSDSGSAVVVAELRSRSERVLGYRLLSCANLQLVNLKTEDIVTRSEKQDNPFLQNGIIRNNTVNCYPHHKYQVLHIEDYKAQQTKVKADAPVQPIPPKRKPLKPKFKQIKPYSEDQKLELSRCLAAGGDAKLLANPELSTEQMRVLWVSKMNGAVAECFKDPRIPTDSMKFYSQRIVSKKIAADCKEMFQHPELSVDQLSELYLCVCAGVDYSDLMDKSPVEIQVERENRSREYWGDAKDLDDGSYLIKAANVASRLKGL